MEVVYRNDLLAYLQDGLISLDAPMEGAFYPVSLGYRRPGAEYPDMWGWAVEPSQREAFEALFMKDANAEVEKAFPDSFRYCEWIDPSSYEVRPVPAPVHADQPLPGHAGEVAMWARFSSYGWMPRQFDLYCDLVSGRCRATARDGKDLPEVSFKVAPGKLLALATLGPAGRYEEHREPLMIYDGDYWDYALGTGSAVLLRGSRRYNGEKGGDPMRQLFHKIKRSGLTAMRSAWGFTI